MRFNWRFAASFVVLVLLLGSCCEPLQKNSQPQMIDSLFTQTSGYDLDLFRSENTTPPQIDSNYYPIYTFAVKNTGTTTDTYTLSLRLGGAGFDITKQVAAGQIAYFRTPTAKPDSFTSGAIYSFPILSLADSNPPIPYAYQGLFAHTPDSTRIRILQPSITLTYGAIDNGNEGCNTPAQSTVIDVNGFPK